MITDAPIALVQSSLREVLPIADRGPVDMSRTTEGTGVIMRIYADELRPGDVVAYDGYDRRITRVDRRDGWAWPVAADGTGWAIALDHRLIDVSRAAA
jgi:hypothetical protein